MLAYRVGWPLWKLAARLHIPLKAKVSIIYDEEVGVFVAECADFPNLGIVTEAPNPHRLKEKLDCCFYEAMRESFRKEPKHASLPTFDFVLEH